MEIDKTSVKGFYFFLIVDNFNHQGATITAEFTIESKVG
jgi:hypothetical protein